MNGATALVASGSETDAIAAAIGGISMSGGWGNIWGTLIGVLVMQRIRNGMNLLGVSSYYQMVIIGLVIIIAVGIDCIRRLRSL
jgi:ribose transport system permease protein